MPIGGSWDTGRVVVWNGVCTCREFERPHPAHLSAGVVYEARFRTAKSLRPSYSPRHMKES